MAEIAVTTPWSPSTLTALRAAPVVPRGALAPSLPTREIDDELYRLTGKRGLPILAGITLGFPATLDVPPDDETIEGTDVRLWGAGPVSIHLARQANGDWKTSSLGSTLDWQGVVELLVLQQAYRSWLPPLSCTDAREALPRRWGRDLATALELHPVPEVKGAYVDADILCWDSTFFSRDEAAFEHVLKMCRQLDFSARLLLSETEPTLVHDIEPRSREPGWSCLLASGGKIQDTVIERREREGAAVRQVSRLRGCVVEIQEVSPDHTQRLRAHLPMFETPRRTRPWSARLQRYMRRHAAALDIPAPEVVVSPKMQERLRSFRDLGAILMSPPHACARWIGVWPFEALPPGVPRTRPVSLATVEGAAKLDLIGWPLFRWGEREMVVVGGAPEFTLYLCDETGAIWLCDPVHGVFDFFAGSLTTWLERIAYHDELEAMGHPSPLVELPCGEGRALPDALGARAIRECSDYRSRLFASEAYVIWESRPMPGDRTVALRARSVSELIDAIDWAKDHWDTHKVAVTPLDASDELTEAITTRGLKLLDGEPGGWRSPAFWEKND